MVNYNSKKQYLTVYMSLVKKAETTDVNEIFDFIMKKDIKDTTKLSYLNSIISLKKLDPSLVDGDLKKIIETRDKMQIELEKKRDENNIQNGQEKAVNNVTLDMLNEFVDELYHNKDNSIKDLEAYILMALMVKFPLRNDLQEVFLTKVKNLLKEPINIMYIPKSGNAILSLKEYKTAKTNGEINLSIPADISDAIRLLVKKRPDRKYLFETKNNEPLSTSTFTHLLNGITKKGLGVKLSSTTIRKIYLTSKYKNIVNEMTHDARIMGHSTETAKNIYIDNRK